MPGFATSAPEVTNVSRHGFWLLLGDAELLVRFSDFAWFRLGFPHSSERRRERTLGI